MFQRFFIVLLLISLGTTSGSSGMADQPEVGQRYPNFTLPDIADGKAVSLNDYRGKKVLLIQFASW